MSSGEYSDLIRELFIRPAAVAFVGSHSLAGNRGGKSEGPCGIAGNLAAELAMPGRRVVVVAVNMLLNMNPITVPQEGDFMPTSTPNIWIWPGSSGQKIEYLKSRETAGPGTWLDSLRRSFDSVLLDCPEVGVAPGVIELAVMADTTVLIAEAGRTSKQQIQQDHRALQLRGARVAGSILVQRR